MQESKPARPHQRPRNRERRGPWYLLTGLALGLLAGTIFSAWLLPADYIDAPPSALQSAYQETYRSLVAQAYLADGDLERARARLVLLADADLLAALKGQAQRLNRDNALRSEAQALALLANDLENNASSLQRPPEGSPTPPGSPQQDSAKLPIPGEQTQIATLDVGQGIHTPTPAPGSLPSAAASYTPRPTNTPTPVMSLPLALKEKRESCKPDLIPGLMQVQLENKEGKPLSGVRITITWKDGEESFFTGLQPQIGVGYADYVMAKDGIYRLRAGENGEIVDDLIAPNCKRPDGSAYIGQYWLRFSD